MKPHNMREKCKPHRNLPYLGCVKIAYMDFCKAWHAASAALNRATFMGMSDTLVCILVVYSQSKSQNSHLPLQLVPWMHLG